MQPTRLAVFFAFALTLSLNAEESIFASGGNKTLNLHPGSEGQARVQIIVRTTGHGASYYSGDIETKGRVAHFESSAFVGNGDGVELKIPITIRLGDDAITIIADFPGELPPEIDPSGTFRKLDAKSHLAFMREGFKEADRALNARWVQLKKSLPADVMADLTERQRGWIERKEYMSRWGAGENFETTPAYWASTWEMTVSRLHFLDIYVGKDVPEGIAGVYVDGNSGLINIVEDGEGKFRFQIHVVRGPTYHSGRITNTVAIREEKGRFVDTDKEAFWHEKPCTIHFEFTGHRLELQCEDTGYYHGARAYFDGTYFKTKGTPEIEEDIE